MNKYPRVLISYFFGPYSIPLGASCARALKSLGCDVFCFDSGSYSPVDRYILKYADKITRAAGTRRIALTSRWRTDCYRQNLLEKAVSEYKPDILLVLRGHGLDGNFLTALKQKYGIGKIVGWWVKGPKWSELMRADAKYYDHYFCIHREGYTAHDNITYFPALAIDSILYRKLYSPDVESRERDYERDVVFVGAWSERRQEFISDLEDLSITIFGPKWWKKNVFNAALRKKIKASAIWGEDLVRLYNSSRIVLNISNWNTSNQSGLNLRIFDVPACGAFLLTDYSEELREYFTPGEDIETFADAAEMKDKIAYYLKNSASRERTALNGHRKVLQLGTFNDKMIDLLNRVWFNK